MKLIPLTQGHFAKIDDEDFDRVSAFKWSLYSRPSINNTCYAKRSIHTKNGTRSIRMHRFILNAPSELHVDHINHDGLDNRKANLRLCTKIDNQRNRRKQKTSPHTYIGVKPAGKKFMARIWQNNKTIHLGTFKTEIEAAKAYDYAAWMFRGEFAKLNFKTAFQPLVKEDK